MKNPGAVTECGISSGKIAGINAKGLQASDPATGSKVLSLLESSKQYLWHGNVATALDRIDDCVMYCDDPELNYANLRALQKQLDEMYTYIRNNQMMIPNIVTAPGFFMLSNVKGKEPRMLSMQSREKLL